VNLSQNHRFEFPYDVASACSLDPIEDAAVLGPISEEPVSLTFRLPAITSRLLRAAGQTTAL
jgi:hypothetical protein